MIKKIKLILASILFLFPFVVYAQSAHSEIGLKTLDAATQSKKMTDAELVKKAAEALMKDNDIPGVAIEMYVDGKPQSYYYGYANREKKLRVTKNTIFELVSISKIMTSLLLAQQVDIAIVSLTDSVKKYVEDLPASFEDISLQDLATHTGGLPFNSPGKAKNRAELGKELASWSPEDAPQDKWAYSNFGMGLLGYALETATHRDYNQLYRRRISNPLSMQPIALSVPKPSMRFYAQGYDKEGKPVKPIEMGLFPAAAGIKASANDMQRFLSAAIGLPGTPELILYPMRMTQAAYVELPDKMQGLGWQIHEVTPENIKGLLDEPYLADISPKVVKHIYVNPTFNGNDLIDKTGTTNGFRAYIALIPNKKSGIVILANRNVPNNAIVNIGRELLFKMTNLMEEKKG